MPSFAKQLASATALLSFCTAVTAQRYGPYVSLGPTSNEILRSETTYTPGAMQPNPDELLFLWPGISDAATPGGDLIQTVAESHISNTFCGAKKGEWCLAPYVMHGRVYAEADKHVAIRADSKIRIIYKKTADGKTWIQQTIDTETGKQLHSYEKGTGDMKGWGTGTESQQANRGTAGTQFYIDTVITLASADPSFGRTIAKTGNAKYEGLTSEQGGKVWKIAKITLPPTLSGFRETAYPGALPKPVNETALLME
ncbi:hypothetical protein K402DRAFT_405435 [Aulographum hederae CBS 113979]|uniref:Uncharacterized protein n=1 Tax=Aulographum hederae CBS 113979 TaxID=1176131 RepID=A0A6G1GWH0_9PEZI|nr:hypothetical protein K402DRAFT_405435 [Aulographum hederae CBS 113979]